MYLTLTRDISIPNFVSSTEMIRVLDVVPFKPLNSSGFLTGRILFTEQKNPKNSLK